MKDKEESENKVGYRPLCSPPLAPSPNTFHSLLTTVNAPFLIKADSQHPHPDHHNDLVQAGLDIRLNIKVFHKIWDIIVVIVVTLVLGRSLLALLNGLVRLSQLA